MTALSCYNTIMKFFVGTSTVVWKKVLWDDSFESISFYDKKPHNVFECRLISNRILVGGRVDVLNN